MTDIHEGGCFCGAVRYRTIGAPKRVSACSCEWCRKRTGSALGVSVYFEQANVEFTKGVLKPFTTVSWTLEFLPGFRGIAGGTFDEPTFWYDLERYVFARSKPDWLTVPEGIDVCQTMPD